MQRRVWETCELLSANTAATTTVTRSLECKNWAYVGITCFIIRLLAKFSEKSRYFADRFEGQKFIHSTKLKVMTRMLQLCNWIVQYDLGRQLSLSASPQIIHRNRGSDSAWLERYTKFLSMRFYLYSREIKGWQLCQISGFAWDTRRNFTEKLRYARYPVVSSTTCQEKLGVKVNDYLEFCTGFEKGEITCLFLKSSFYLILPCNECLLLKRLNGLPGRLWRRLGFSATKDSRPIFSTGTCVLVYE